MRLLVLIAWGGTVFAVFMVTVLTSISQTDDDGRVTMPGRAVLHLQPGSYGVWYEEPHGTPDNEAFSPPPGIRVH